MIASNQYIIYAVAGSFLPALLWLWFWRKEDSKHPEPRRLIALTFIGGIIAVVPVLQLEKYVYVLFSDDTVRFFLWAVIEELAKLIAAFLFVLRRKEVDEPLDPVIYLITAALGFSAIENFLFIWNPVTQGFTMTGIITGDLRFIGATLLHTAASAIIGISLAFGFYSRRRAKWAWLSGGIILAIALHTLFNSTIIIVGGDKSLLVSSAIWALIVVLLLVLEKVKRLHPTSKIR